MRSPRAVWGETACHLSAGCACEKALAGVSPLSVPRLPPTPTQGLLWGLLRERPPLLGGRLLHSGCPRGWGSGLALLITGPRPQSEMLSFPKGGDLEVLDGALFLGLDPEEVPPGLSQHGVKWGQEGDPAGVLPGRGWKKRRSHRAMCAVRGLHAASPVLGR